MSHNVISVSGAGVHENLPALVTTCTSKIGGQYQKFITILTSHFNVRYPIISLINNGISIHIYCLRIR